MSLLDKFIAAVTPPESPEARAKAREKARAAATPGDWLSLVLDHHLQLEAAFDAVKATRDAGPRRAAQKELALLLTGHAIAEEAVLYPGLVDAGETAHADMGYTEQAMVKMQMAALETIDPMSQDFLDKLEHIRGAVAHHMYEEEGTWFLEIKEKASASDQARLSRRFQEEFDRYVGGERTDRAVETRSWEELRPGLA